MDENMEVFGGSTVSVKEESSLIGGQGGDGTGAVYEQTLNSGGSTMEEDAMEEETTFNVGEFNESGKQIILALPALSNTSMIFDDEKNPFIYEFPPSNPVISSSKSPKNEDTSNVNVHKSPQHHSPSYQKRNVGRPSGTGKWPNLTVDGAMPLDILVPYMLSVQNGENIMEKLDAFMRINKIGLYILSAIGQVSSVHLRRLTSFDGISKYQGSFNLLSISGSQTYNGELGDCSGSLSAILSSPNSQIFGGTL